MGGENPYDKLKFNPKYFNETLDKISSSFDSLISEATMLQGQAAGITSGDTGRVAAETYVKAAGQRNQSEAQVLGQKSAAATEFESQRQQKSAEWEAQQAGPLDFIFNTVIPTAGSVAGVFFPPAALATVGSKAIGGLTKKNTGGTPPALNPEVQKNLETSFGKDFTKGLFDFNIKKSSSIFDN